MKRGILFKKISNYFKKTLYIFRFLFIFSFIFLDFLDLFDDFNFNNNLFFINRNNNYNFSL